MNSGFQVVIEKKLYSFIKYFQSAKFLAQKLKMEVPLVQGRSSPEGHLEYILNLCSLGQLVSKIGNELYNQGWIYFSKI